MVTIRGAPRDIQGDGMSAEPSVAFDLLTVLELALWMSMSCLRLSVRIAGGHPVNRISEFMP
jgi:hypothetical protein